MAFRGADAVRFGALDFDAHLSERRQIRVASFALVHALIVFAFTSGMPTGERPSLSLKNFDAVNCDPMTTDCASLLLFRPSHFYLQPTVQRPESVNLSELF
jgi:hypothetical protein